MFFVFFCGSIFFEPFHVEFLRYSTEGNHETCTLESTVKKSGGSMFGRAIGNVAGSAAANAIKAKDEVSLEYKLDHVETTKTSLTNKDKAKASDDSEDVISSLVQKAAGAILSTVRR